MRDDWFVTISWPVISAIGSFVSKTVVDLGPRSRIRLCSGKMLWDEDVRTYSRKRKGLKEDLVVVPEAKIRLFSPPVNGNSAADVPIPFLSEGRINITPIKAHVDIANVVIRSMDLLPGDEEIGTSNMEDNPQPNATQANQQPSASNTSSRSHGQSWKRSIPSMNLEVEAAMTTAIESIGDVGKRIAAALEGTNWAAVEKWLWEVPGMNNDDMITMIELFEKDDKLARIFLGLSASVKEHWVIRKLGRRPGSYADIDFHS